jgi:hypothetical protein
MIYSFAMMHAGSQPARDAIQFMWRGNVPGTTRIALLQFFGIFTRAGTD